MWAERLGRQLRDRRRAHGYSLHDVELLSDGEFRASALSAYERGERSMSIPRLMRLAAIYAVPAAELLPPSFLGTAVIPDEAPNANDRADVAIDLVVEAARESASIHQGAARPRVGLDALLVQYLDAVARWRRDAEPHVLTFRRADLQLLSAIVGSDAKVLRTRLVALAVRDVVAASR